MTPHSLSGHLYGVPPNECAASALRHSERVAYRSPTTGTLGPVRMSRIRQNADRHKVDPVLKMSWALLLEDLRPAISGFPE